MITNSLTGGRPQGDRDNATLIRENDETLAIYTSLMEEAKLGRLDINEGIARALSLNAEFRALALSCALEVRNENRKYPEELPGSFWPELTPEVAYENFDAVIKEVYKGYDARLAASPVTTTQELELPEGPNLWTEMEGSLKKRVSEENWDIWLDSVHFLKVEDGCLVLVVPNTYFQQYLTKHYTEVITEELHRTHNQTLTVTFETVTEATTVTTTPPQVNSLLKVIEEKNISTLDDLEALEDSGLESLYQDRLDAAQVRCTPIKGADALGPQRRGDLHQSRYAEEVAILKARRLKEEARRVEFRKQRRAIFAVCGAVALLRQPGTPQGQRLYHEQEWREATGTQARRRVGSSTMISQSAFETEGGATRKDRAELERAFRKPAPS